MVNQVESYSSQFTQEGKDSIRGEVKRRREMGSTSDFNTPLESAVAKFKELAAEWGIQQHLLDANLGDLEKHWGRVQESTKTDDFERALANYMARGQQIERMLHLVDKSAAPRGVEPHDPFEESTSKAA